MARQVAISDTWTISSLSAAKSTRVMSYDSVESLDIAALRQRVVGMTQGLGILKTEAVKRLAREMNVSRRELYRLLIEDEEDS